MSRRIALLLTLLAFALPALADPPMTTLRVEVKSATGKPVDRATVVVRFVQGRSAIKLGKKIRKNWEMRTSQEGVARIPAIPQGTILIQVIAKGFQTFGQSYDVNQEEKTIEIALNPPQPQHSEHQ